MASKAIALALVSLGSSVCDTSNSEYYSNRPLVQPARQAIYATRSRESTLESAVRDNSSSNGLVSLMNYSAADRERLEKVNFEDAKSRNRFLLAMERMRKYGLESKIQRYCDRFGVDKEYVIPFFIEESNMNVNAPTTIGKCTGIGQVTPAAVKSVNRSFGTRFRHTNKPKFIDDQIGSAVGYFSLKVNSLKRKYDIDEDTAVRLAYFAYNAGGAPVDLVVRDLNRKGLDVTWENVESRITPDLLRRSSRFYRKWGNKPLKKKVGIIKNYVDDTATYRDYLDQLKR